MKKPIILKKYTLTTANDSETYSYRNPNHGICMAQIMEHHGHR